MFPIRWNFPFRKNDGSLTTIAQAISEGGGSYTLPTASAEIKGGVKIGSGLSMEGEVLNNTNPTPYSLPTASDEVLGGVKVGTGLTMSGGVLRNNNPLPVQSDVSGMLNVNTTYSHLKISKSGNIVEITGFIILTNELDVGERIQISQNGIPSDDRIEGGWFPMVVTMSDANVTKFTIATLTAYANGNLFVNNNFADVKAKYLYVSCRYRIGDYTLH